MPAPYQAHQNAVAGTLRGRDRILDTLPIQRVRSGEILRGIAIPHGVQVEGVGLLEIIGEFAIPEPKLPTKIRDIVNRIRMHVVADQESLEQLLHRLLCMKTNLAPPGVVRRSESDLSQPQVLLG